MKTSQNPNPTPEPNPGHAPQFRRTQPAFALALAFAVAAATLANSLSPTARASTLTASDGAANDVFGQSASASGSGALVGATGYPFYGNYNNSVYYYNGLDSVNGNSTTETVKLIAADAAAGDQFGYRVSLSGANALVGAYQHDANGKNDSGAAYYYKGLDAVPQDSPVPETVKLIASDGAAQDSFGRSVSLSGADALVGAWHADGKENDSGAAYYYKGLDAVDPQDSPVPETVKLIASDGAAGDYFGTSVSLSGADALVGAVGDDNGGNWNGAAYYYKGLDAVAPQTTQVIETVKLIASDGAGSGEVEFGGSVSLSGANALVTASSHNNYRGAAYYYQGLDTVDSQTDPVTETVKLLASDGADEAYFGSSGSLSGYNALVGASSVSEDEEYNIGAAYYYKGLDAVGPQNSPVYETVKLLASDGAAGAFFGTSVSLDGDRFVISAHQATVNGVTRAGKAYAGDIRAFTTLDAGNGTALATDGLSFVSQTDWIIGAETANNTVTLTAGDTATVTADGKAVYIGQNAGADNNTLLIEGALTATTVYVGAADTVGNTLRFTTAALDTLTIGTVYLDAGNFLDFEDADHAIDLEDVATLLSGATVRVRDSSSEGWVLLTTDNAATLLVKMQDVEDGTGGTWSRFTPFTASPVPEPATWAALAGLALLAFAVALRRPRGNRA
ncbi:MAG: FG-GAP repeat protein [Opitutaceae bacterium]|jgi:hypothetical protein|nr:FG-GAP repeat protein [Opitutaceae bacterium]